MKFMSNGNGNGNESVQFPYRQVYSGVLGNAVATPIVTLSAQNQSTGEWFNIELEFDTGAMISLLPRSAAAVLGINLVKGYPITLMGVGGALIRAYVHPVTIKFQRQQLEIYVAFATVEVPPLLGRFTVFNQIGEIELNNESGVLVFEKIRMESLPKLPGWEWEIEPPQANPALATISLMSPIAIALIIAASVA